MNPESNDKAADGPNCQRRLVRTPGDGQLWEEEIESHVALRWDENLHEYVCDHFPIAGGRWEKFWMRLKTPHPELGKQVRPGAMCCECYRKLRRLGLAPFRGTWGDSPNSN